MIVKHKQLIKWIVPLLSLGFLTVVLIVTKQINHIWGAIQQMRPGFILIALFFIVGYWFFEALILYKLAQHSDGSLKFKEAFKITLAGQFFNGVTPFAAGGQPAQLYMMHKQNISLGTGASILTRKFIVYQSALVIYCLFVVIFEYSYFMKNIPHFAYLGLIGFILNLIVIIALLFVGYRYSFTKRVAIAFINFWKKHFTNYKVKKWMLHLMQQLDDFHYQMDRTNEKGYLWLQLAIMTFFQLTLFFSIPLIIGYGFHLSNLSILYMIGAASFVSMITAFIPIPGAAIGAEGSFFLVYQIFFPAKLVVTALLIWRIITYYLPLIIGGIVVMTTSNKEV